MEEAAEGVDIAPGVDADGLEFTLEDAADAVDFADGEGSYEGHYCCAGVGDALDE